MSSGLQPGSSVDAKPQLLFLCQTLPYPPDGGVHIRSYHMLRLLSQWYQVTALFFVRSALRPTPEMVSRGLSGLRRLCDAEAFSIPQELSRLRFLWDHGRSVVARRAYTVYTYESSDFRKRLQGLLKTRDFRLIHVDSLDLATYLPLFKGLPVVCGHHNVESELLARRAAVESSTVIGKYLALQSRLTRREEEQYCPKVRLNITCSEADKQLLERIAPGAAVVCIPNGVDTRSFKHFK